MKSPLNKGLALAVVSAGAASCAPQAEEPMHRMNVIYILADDLGYGDLGCTGSTKILTPNIDRMRAEGMLFTQHYSGSTVSAPSVLPRRGIRMTPPLSSVLLTASIDMYPSLSRWQR